MADAQVTRSKTAAARTSGGEDLGAGAEATKKTLPVSENPLVIRTDFSDQATWEAIVRAIRTTSPDGYEAHVDLLDDLAFQGLTATQVLGLASKEYTSQHNFLMIVDHVTITDPQHPLVIVNLSEDEADEDGDEPVEPQYGREFRAVPEAIQNIENNLSIVNMDFEDYADAVGEDGVFRDFSDLPD